MIEFEEKNKDAKRMIADLKNQVREIEMTKNNLEQQLKKKMQESERIEQEVMHLRNKLDEESINSRYENSSRTLDEILSVQRPSSDKSWLGFDKEKPGYSSCTNQDGNKRIYVFVLMSQIKREESNKYASPLQRTYMMLKRPVTSKH